MPYFLSFDNLETGQHIRLVGEEATHLLLARRLKVGENVKLQGPNQRRFLCRVVEVKKRAVALLVGEMLQTPPEPSLAVVLFQAVVGQAALDWVFQKSTELQADGVVLFNSQNTATRLTLQKFQEKRARWEKILWEAAKQCERVRPPSLGFVPGVSETIEPLKTYNKVVVLDPNSHSKFKDLGPLKAKKVAVVVGPEGGFTFEENQRFLNLKNSVAVNLGPVLLRAETAALAGLVLVANSSNNI